MAVFSMQPTIFLRRVTRMAFGAMGTRPPWASSLSLYNMPTSGAWGTSGLESWTSSSLGVDPRVIHNTNSSPTTFLTVTVPAGGLQFHPGPNARLSVIRWTAPQARVYDLNVAFSGNDSFGPT